METALTRLIQSDGQQKAKRGTAHTPEEIYKQVEIWSDTSARIRMQEARLREIFTRVKSAKRPAAIVCTGAGTSEFAGYCLEALLRKRMGMAVNVISSARIVSTPEDCFTGGYQTLLLSFARSGDSPESLGSVRIADMLATDVSHLAVTCNARGALFNEINGRADGLAVALDERCNDLGLAMTASFTNMVVAGQTLAHLYALPAYERQLDNLIRAGAAIRDAAPAVTEQIAGLGFERAVFLGDGANYGTAIESHLKLQELTAGQVMCTWDSFAGLRHGPEAVIHPNTLVVAYLATDAYTRRYQLDLIRGIHEKAIGKALLCVAHSVPDEIRRFCDYTIEYGQAADAVADDLLPPAYVLVGQLLGLFTSLKRGLKPDNPSPQGVIHRVVEGVKVYDPEAFRRSGKARIIAER